jgi:hypothetical protein
MFLHTERGKMSFTIEVAYISMTLHYWTLNLKFISLAAFVNEENIEEYFRK